MSSEDDGFKVHYDQKRGRLEIACDTGSYKRFRDLVSHQFTDIPEINFDNVVEIEILDSAKFVARGDTMRSSIMMRGLIGIVGLIFASSLIGFIVILRWLRK